MRLNRMFWADGDAGLARFAGLVDGYAREGFRTELQVRYHPPEGRAGDIAGWLEYVRAAVRTFAPRRSVVALSITNEANLPGSPNTSDGFYAGVRDALVQGVIAARAEADRLGRAGPLDRLLLRLPQQPAGRRRVLGGARRQGRRRRSRPRSTTSGCRSTPGLFWPPATTDPAGDVIEAMTLLRDCWMPKAGLGRDVAAVGDRERLRDARRHRRGPPGRPT